MLLFAMLVFAAVLALTASGRPLSSTSLSNPAPAGWLFWLTAAEENRVHRRERT